MIANRRKGLFNSSRAERFYHVLLQSSSTGYQEDLESSITIIKENLDAITDAIKTIDERQFEDDALNNNKNNEHALYTRNLLELLLSEKTVADYIVTYRIDFLFVLLKQVKDKRLSQSEIGMGFKKLVRCLFENPNSYLYKQLDYEGITLYAPIYDILFGETYFIEEFSILSIWDEYGVAREVRLNPQYIQVYLQALEKAIEVNKFQNEAVSRKIALSIFYKLGNYAGYVISTVTKQESGYNATLMDVVNFFGRDFPIAYKKYIEENTISISEQEAKRENRFQQSLTATYAETLARFLENLSQTESELERDWALSATDEVLPIHDDGEYLIIFVNAFLNISGKRFKRMSNEDIFLLF